MLASETIRQAPVANGDSETAAAVDEHFAELVVLDRAGRIHVPQEYLEHFEIKGRAQLEITDDGILIRPAVQTRTEQIKVEGKGAADGKIMPPMDHAGAQSITRERGEKRSFFGRFGRKNRS
jgi:bifunctional DNA-binding transcriptional regulator/antitoxin component of YhaV-PrlF toxin-antitoxin module